MEKQKDRRANRGDRRILPRGGRRRSDWPEDAGITACPRCGFPHPHLTEVRRTEYRWFCGDCRRSFVTRRATRVIF